MKLITSQKFKLPVLYLVTSEKELLELPLGLPFIRANIKNYDSIVRLLEWDILYKAMVATGFPFNWKKILEDNGYTNLIEGFASSEIADLTMLDDDIDSPVFYYDEYVESDIKEFVADCSYIVNLELLQSLKLLPSMFDIFNKELLKKSIAEELLFNPLRLNKKLGMCVGDVEFTEPDRNCAIFDLSGSIPSSIANTMLLFCKTFIERYNCDVIFTGSISKFYTKEEVFNLDIDKVYDEIGRDNESEMFRELMYLDKSYSTVIVFGDNHTHGDKWQGSKTIDIKTGKTLCKWKVNKVISFHTTSNYDIAGYGTWFDAPVEIIKDWVTYINK